MDLKRKTPRHHIFTWSEIYKKEVNPGRSVISLVNCHTLKCHIFSVDTNTKQLIYTTNYKYRVMSNSTASLTIPPDFFAFKIYSGLSSSPALLVWFLRVWQAVKSSNNLAVTKKPIYCWISNVFNTSAVSNAFLRVVIYNS